MRIIDKAFPELTVHELYAILRLRMDVFVVEQACAYPELDGRDAEPETRHLWVPADGDGLPGIATYLRVLNDGDGVRIGRVVTSPGHRGRGLSGALLRHAIDANAHARIDIDAQSHLSRWYEGFGFQVNGEEFLEDGIPHLPMHLDPRSG